ncbi:MAG: hypothetical protein PHX78_11090 [bacterium]|nr:hypothetical protein [bacterium]
MSAPAAGSYLYYVNSWLLAKGGYVSVLGTFCFKVAFIILILGIFVYSLKKNNTFEE